MSADWRQELEARTRADGMSVTAGYKLQSRSVIITALHTMHLSAACTNISVILSRHTTYLYFVLHVFLSWEFDGRRF